MTPLFPPCGTGVREKRARRYLHVTASPTGSIPTEPSEYRSRRGSQFLWRRHGRRPSEFSLMRRCKVKRDRAWQVRPALSEKVADQPFYPPGPWAIQFPHWRLQISAPGSTGVSEKPEWRYTAAHATSRRNTTPVRSRRHRARLSKAFVHDGRCRLSDYLFVRAEEHVFPDRPSCPGCRRKMVDVCRSDQ